MITNRAAAGYQLTNADKARFRRAATRYAPVMSLKAAYWLLMLKAYTARDGDMVLLKPGGSRPTIEQFASIVGQRFDTVDCVGTQAEREILPRALDAVPFQSA